MFDFYGVQIHWLGHSAFKIKGRRTLYIDPFHIKDGQDKADVILITHNHFDHCDVESLEKIVAPHTIIICATDCLSTVTRVGHVMDIKPITPGKSLEVFDIKVQAHPAYNTNKEFHPKHNEWVSYLININGVKIFHAGDSDAIPEFKDLRPDIALLPVSGVYVMTATEAADLAKTMQAKIAIPMHYDEVIGSSQDAEQFKTLVGETARILDKE